MKLKGGYNINLEGRPSKEVKVLTEPENLYLPLKTRRFSFSELSVREGEKVGFGHILARDPQNHQVPLLAPRAGTVNLIEGHIVLKNISKLQEDAYVQTDVPINMPKNVNSAGMKRYKLLSLGAWQFFYDAYTGELPNPFGEPRALIVSMVNFEPFVARGDAQLYNRLDNFVRGLTHLQTLVEYKPIYLVLLDIESDFARVVREALRGYAWVNMIKIPPKYPFDNFTLLARKIGLKAEKNQSIWAMRTNGVLAVDRALTQGLPSTERIIAIGGPAVNNPEHLQVLPGYPLAAILKTYVSSTPVRLINGGVLTGTTIQQPNQLGVNSESEGLTVLPEAEAREFLGFMRPGWERYSYSNCFISKLRKEFNERFTTALRGERRACVACNYCEEVCPAGIMPHLIHKYLYQDALEEAQQVGLELCIGCGLCAFVCPSKIELLAEINRAKQELQLEEVEE